MLLPHGPCPFIIPYHNRVDESSSLHPMSFLFMASDGCNQQWNVAVLAMPGSGPPVLQCDVLTFRSETTTWSFHLSHICKEPKANLKDRDTKGCICCKCANLSVKPGAYFKEIKQVQLNSSPFGPEDRPKKTSLTSVMLCFALGCFSDAYFGLSQFLLLRSFPRGLETSEIIFFLCICWVLQENGGDWKSDSTESDGSLPAVCCTARFKEWHPASQVGPWAKSYTDKRETILPW